MKNILYLVANPLDIATGAEGGTVTIDAPGEDSFARTFQFANLFHYLRRDALIVGTIVIVGLLLSMLLISKSEKLADKKSDIYHKCLILLLICSTLFLLSLFVSLFDWIF